MAKSSDQQSAAHLLVVIDHQEAKIYHIEVDGGLPMRIAPFDPQGHRKHLHSLDEWTSGKRQAESKSFYEAIAQTLQGADQILLFGSGTGRSSAMDVLLTDLKKYHADVAKKVIGAVVVDAHHSTEGQLLAKAREIYADFNRK